MENNALEVRAFCQANRISFNACCAMLGNMQSESGINPGIWESLIPYGSGVGLTQWTPYTKLLDWAGAEWQDGTKQMQRILYEAENGLQWFRNEELGLTPPITFKEFLKSDLDLTTLANFWCWFYEHPAEPMQPIRATQAIAWSEFLDPYSWEIPAWLLFKFQKRSVYG